MHDSRTVANRFLELGRRDGVPMTSMKLLKLVYIAHGWNLGLYGRPLIRDDVQAWKYGPVIPRLYTAVKDFKSVAIDRNLAAPWNDVLTPAEENIVKQVYDIYGKKSAFELSALTHQSGTPWEYTYDPDEFETIIPMDLIQAHYERLAKENA